MSEIIHCADCGAECKPDGCATGYGVDRDNRKICYACCGYHDRAEMMLTGRATLYLTYDVIPAKPGTPWGRGIHNARVTNWPGSLSIRAGIKSGRHNIAGRRYDVWFTFAGRTWHGVQYGDNTQICHCRITKG